MIAQIRGLENNNRDMAQDIERYWDAKAMFHPGLDMVVGYLVDFPYV